MIVRWGGIAVMLALLAVPGRAQEETPQQYFGFGKWGESENGDYHEYYFTDQVIYRLLGVEYRAERAFALVDRDAVEDGVQELTGPGGLPRRGTAAPDPRRAIDEEEIRRRLRSFLSATGNQLELPEFADGFEPQSLQSVYLEGDVRVIRDGQIVVEAESMFLSVIDDRVVIRNATLRLQSRRSDGSSRTVVVSGDRFVREGKRIMARDVTVTTCTAGHPHFAVYSGEIEMIERENEFEIRSKDNQLSVGGLSLLPLPDVDFFTGTQSNVPLKGASVGYSQRDGTEISLVFGSTLNETGGMFHEWLTGGDPDEFRGDWRFNFEWLENRGFPLTGAIQYEVPGSYQGRAEGFWLDDKGTDIGNILTYLDGTLIDERNRNFISWEHRAFLGENTRIDAQVWDSSDPAVYSQFFRQRYFDDELPETSVNLRHAEDNFIVYAGGRWNLANFSYGDARNLVPGFTEEQPQISADLFSEPILSLPGDAELLLTSSTNIGQFETEFDPRFPTPIDNRTVRLDQEIELAAPYRVGSWLNVRPFASARFTHYDDTVARTSKDRWAFDAGVDFGTRLSKSWNDGGRVIRHVMSPTVTVANRFKVDGDPGDYFQFDAIDALDEQSRIRIGLLQQWQTGDGEDNPLQELVWLDLAQNIVPLADRDNAGERLGLFEYELALRPGNDTLGLPVQVVTEGEWDWDLEEFRTWNNALTVTTGRTTWFTTYRDDNVEKGVVGYGVSSQHRKRWTLTFSSQYDLQQKTALFYGFDILRTDHDWLVRLGVDYDNFTDELSFRFMFEPTLGDLFRTRAERQRRRTNELFGTGGDYARY